MFGAGVPLRTDHRDHLAVARMKRIKDPNLKRRTPGSMTLLRVAPAKPIFALASLQR
jgi:hypothetical protein